jgi:hypothetical protein
MVTDLQQSHVLFLLVDVQCLLREICTDGRRKLDAKTVGENRSDDLHMGLIVQEFTFLLASRQSLELTAADSISDGKAA